MYLIKNFKFTQMMVTILSLSSLIIGCVESGNGRRKSTATTNASGAANSGESGLGGQGSAGTGSTLGGGSTLTGTQVEINFVVNPYSGSYTTKLTLPKDYNGQLSLAGINVQALSQYLFKVRFNLGKNLTPIVVPATVGQTTGGGLTGTTQVSAIVLDLSNAPFSNLTLPYDLYDYTNYDVSDTPTSDPFSEQLYCRGLKVQDDPTNENGVCLGSGDSCLYSYAKIVDAGLYFENQNLQGTLTSLFPEEAKIDLSGNGYNSDSAENKIKKCLPDNGLVKYSGSAGSLSMTTTGQNTAQPTTTGTFVQTALNPSSGLTHDFRYFGPYLVVDQSNWEIGPNAAIHDHLSESDPSKNTPRAIFAKAVNGDIRTGFYSYMFPRAGIKQLNSGASYVGGSGTLGDPALLTSYNVTADRNVLSMNASGDSETMDGCDIRVTSYNSSTGEHIGSCQISATIEIVQNEGTSNEVVLASTKNLKIQFINSSASSQANNTPFSGFSNCTGQSSCGSSECCFSGKCVDEQLVSQCFSGSQTQGASGNTQACSNDLQCASLCCRQGVCAPHNNIVSPPILCNKNLGQSCISNTFCAQQVINVCRKVLGPVVGGQPTCSIQCYPTPTHGSCESGVCTAPSTPAVFPDSNLNDCSNAVAP